eukprot:gene42085-52170_t
MTSTYQPKKSTELSHLLRFFGSGWITADVLRGHGPTWWRKNKNHSAVSDVSLVRFWIGAWLK